MDKTLQLRPYQQEAATFLYERDRAMILAPVGAGKTAITLTAMDEMLRDGIVNRWLVVAPKRVCTDVWPVEAPKWSGVVPALAVGTPVQRVDALQSDASVVVINYDNLDKLEDLSSFDGIVFDELTRLKNPSGKRFKSLEKLLANVKIRWGLTGSFTSNGLQDVFGQCKIIDQTLLGRAKGAFMQQYFICTNRDFGQWVPAAGGLEQVMQRIRPATFVLEPGEYKDKLPPCHVNEVRVSLTHRKPYDDMKREYVARLGDDKIVAQNAAAMTTKLQQMASGFAYRGGAGEPGHWHIHPKDPALTAKGAVWFSSHKFDRLEELLSENQRANTIIAYTYQEELAELKRRFPHAKTMDDPNIIEHWNAGQVELLLAHPKSAGHGLNLQHGGCHMVFLSLPWSLELYEQTVGRLHRSGQTKDVWVYVMLTEKSIDERIWAALHDKRAVSDIALEELKNE